MGPYVPSMSIVSVLFTVSGAVRDYTHDEAIFHFARVSHDLKSRVLRDEE